MPHHARFEVHRPEKAPPRSVTAAPTQLREALCLSSRRSLSLLSSSQKWAEAASFLHGVDSRDPTLQLIPLRSAQTALSLPGQLRDVQGVVAPHASVSRSWRHRCRRSARRPGRGAAGSSSVDPDTAARWQPFLQPSLSASSAMRHASSSHRHAFLLPLQQRDWLRPRRRSWLRCTAATAHLLEKRTLHMRLLHAYGVLQTDAPSRCSHAHGPSIPAPGSPAAAQAVEPCACRSTAPQVCRLRPKGHACRRTPLLRVNRADAAALAAPPHACSDYACPPVVAPRMHNSNQSESDR